MHIAAFKIFFLPKSHKERVFSAHLAPQPQVSPPPPPSLLPSPLLSIFAIQRNVIGAGDAISGSRRVNAFKNTRRGCDGWEITLRHSLICLDKKKRKYTQALKCTCEGPRRFQQRIIHSQYETDLRRRAHLTAELPDKGWMDGWMD